MVLLYTSCMKSVNISGLFFSFFFSHLKEMTAMCLDVVLSPGAVLTESLSVRLKTSDGCPSGYFHNVAKSSLGVCELTIFLVV